MSLDIQKELTSLCDKVHRMVEQAEKELGKLEIESENIEQNVDGKRDE